MRLDTRSAGLLLHPTSLPGPFESGDLGPAAHAFVDLAAEAGCSWWQMLPLGPVGHGSSPYATTSVFAGSPELVSLERLRDDGLLAADDPSLAPVAGGRRADLIASKERRARALRTAFAASRNRADTRDAIDKFRAENAAWLDDYARFAAIKEAHGDAPFFQWPEPLKRREPSAVAAFEREHAEDIERVRFVQTRFASDLAALVSHGREKGVALMGDAPIYVAHDSADVWAHPELFLLDEHGDPTVVAGVPPDAFSDEGQLWGNPLYDWEAHARTGFWFWIARMRHLLAAFEAVRLDHFIGFCRYYAVERGAKDAKKGEFRDVPGYRLFDALFKALGPAQFVAEDLGVVTDAVRKLRDNYRLPGMNILEFSFSPGRGAESSRPHRYAQNSVVYTGTHDNDTAVGWLSGPPDEASDAVKERYQRERDFAVEYLGLPVSASAREAARELVRAALRSQATTAILPVQDILGLGREARMNRPGLASGNWDFRMMEGELTSEIVKDLAKLVDIYGRAPER